MTSDASALIAAGSALLGGVVGTAGTLLAVRSQHRRDVEQALRDEGHNRSRDAALAPERLLVSLAVDIPGQHRSRSDSDRDERIRANSNEMVAALGDLPEPWRGRLLEGWRFLSWSDEIGGDGRGGAFHYQSSRSIAHEVAGNMQTALAAFLRNEDDLPAVTQRWIEYGYAYEAADNSMGVEYADQIADHEHDRALWLDQHPELQTELARSELPKYLGET